MRRHLCGGGGAAVLSPCCARARGLWVLIAPAGVLAAEPCPNEALRAQDGYSLALPDCRAYEQVSPVDKEDQEVSGVGSDGAFAGLPGEPLVQSSTTGEAVTYVGGRASAGNGSGRKGNQFLAVRGAGGWSCRDISPPLDFRSTPEYEAFSPDLSIGC